MMNLVDTFSEFKAGKNIDRPTMVRVLEDVFRTLIRKKYGSDENFDVIVNTTKGDLELWRVREIVPDGEVTDDRSQISISEALLSMTTFISFAFLIKKSTLTVHSVNIKK